MFKKDIQMSILFKSFILVGLYASISAANVYTLETDVTKGETIEISINLSIADIIEGIDMVVEFDENVIDAKDAILDERLKNNSYQLISNLKKDNQALLTVFSKDEPIIKTGRILTLSFGVVGQAYRSTTVFFREYTFKQYSKPGSFCFYGNYIDEIQLSVVPQKTFNLDIDQNYQVDALSDGLMIMHYLSQGNINENTIDFVNGTRVFENEIIAYIEKGLSNLDIDCSGSTEADKDGKLLLLYLFQFTGDHLLENTVDEKSVCNTEERIIQNIENLLPYRMSVRSY